MTNRCPLQILRESGVPYLQQSPAESQKMPFDGGVFLIVLVVAAVMALALPTAILAGFVLGWENGRRGRWLDRSFWFALAVLLVVVAIPTSWVLLTAFRAGPADPSAPLRSADRQKVDAFFSNLSIVLTVSPLLFVGVYWPAVALAVARHGQPLGFDLPNRITALLVGAVSLSLTCAATWRLARWLMASYPQ